MATSLTLKLAAGRQVNTLWAVIGAGFVVIIALFVHSYNMFANPLYLGDEGIYMSQAYAVLKLGRITPYAYWYDHAPVGWLFIALWTALSGGFYSFGTAVNSGRAFMLLLHSASLILIYYTVLRLTASTAMATATGLLYTLSPLTVIYGRLVLLDNIMIFWLLVATVIFIQQEGKLWPIVFSGFFFGVAVGFMEPLLQFRFTLYMRPCGKNCFI
jgi:4-amino-4-deoxy-L-arabinose transferase-like glycosyltransferase